VLLRRDGDAARFVSLRQMAMFLTVVLVATGVVAGGVVGVYHLAGLLGGEAGAALTQSWIGDFVGIAVTTPAVLLLAATPLRWRPSPVDLLQGAAIAASFWLVFGSGLGDPARLFYVLFLPLVWIAMRRGLPGAAAASVLIQVGLVAALGRQAGALLDFQFLMLALCVTGLLLGTAVSDQRRIERDLRDKQAELDRSLRMAAASELASALAHELQQPLMAIGNYVRAGTLMAGRPEVAPAEVEATMRKALAETERASQVVRRLRDFFRTGTVVAERVDARALAHAAATAVRERAARSRIAVVLEANSATIPAVQADPVQIESVLSNLLANALDAAEAADGERRIGIALTHDGAEVVFAVTDSGAGVPAEVEPRLFEHFATSKPQGMGLGLAISRSIVQAHGGRLWHERTPRGTVFAFTLPVAP
jgi:signal transduction histidine kinase